MAAFGDEAVSIRRIGVDGDVKKALLFFKLLDGQVDAFGLGGTDLYIYAGAKRYIFRESKKFTQAAAHTPLADGSGLKNTLERRVIEWLWKEKIIDFPHMDVLMVCGVDRFGMAGALETCARKVIYGDLLYGLGVPLPICGQKKFYFLSRCLAPLVTQLPIRFLYPTGKKQKENRTRYAAYFRRADVICGDFHFIRRNMPGTLAGKTIITNTVTQEDSAFLKASGVKLLVTTTPELEGRSFGTNVIEAAFLALAGKHAEQLQPEDYEMMLDAYHLKPRIQYFY